MDRRILSRLLMGFGFIIILIGGYMYALQTAIGYSQGAGFIFLLGIIMIVIGWAIKPHKEKEKEIEEAEIEIGKIKVKAKNKLIAK